MQQTCVMVCIVICRSHRLCSQIHITGSFNALYRDRDTRFDLAKSGIIG